MKSLILFFAVLAVSACQSTPKVTKQQAFPLLYQNEIKSIIVLPVSNTTTEAAAATQYATTLAKPLAEAGYYVFSIPYIESFFANEGIVDGAQLKQIPLTRYKEMFGADAILFIDLHHWNTSYIIAAGAVSVGAKFELVGIDTGDTLWRQNETVVESTTGDSDSFLLNLILTAVNTANTDYMPIAKRLNQRVIGTLPVGKYHESHRLDQGDSAHFSDDNANYHQRQNQDQTNKQKRAKSVTNHAAIQAK
jgi:hypothetical protein